MMKKIAACLLATLMIGSAAACDEDGTYEQIAPFVPAGWLMVTVEQDDFDGNGITDAIVLVEEADQVYDETHGFYSVPRANPARRLMLLMGTEEGYVLAAQIDATGIDDGQYFSQSGFLPKRATSQSTSTRTLGGTCSFCGYTA